MSEADDANGQELQRFSKSVRVVWAVTLGLRSLHGPQSNVSELCVCLLYAFMCYSH